MRRLFQHMNNVAGAYSWIGYARASTPSCLVKIAWPFENPHTRPRADELREAAARGLVEPGYRPARLKSERLRDGT